MTHRRDDHTFEDAIDSAIHDMHHCTPRGNGPSARAWKQVQEAAGIESTESAAAQTSGHRQRASRESGSANRIPGRHARSRSYLNWATWLAAALIVGLIATNFYFLMPEDGDQGTGQHIALAPGTPDFSIFPQLQVATPIASPGAYIPTYGPEHACHAEPLTEDQVFDIVMNPMREHVRRGANDKGPHLAKPYESDMYILNQVAHYPSNSTYEVTEDPELQQPLKGAANQFWNCLMTGTAFQVWALIDPTNVQREILQLYPVLRDEATLRQHIKEWGPRQYTDAIVQTFPDLGNIDPFEAAMFADQSWGSVLFQGDLYPEGQYAWARVRMAPNEESTRWGRTHIQLDMVRAPDGTWWVGRILYNQD